MAFRIAAFSTLIAQIGALADPLVTEAAQIAPRDVDPGLVGYISANGGFSDSRSCDWPQTVSTSGSFVQCCPTTGACPFYTSCSSNTLLAASATVPCDVDPGLTCNTALVLPTAGAANAGSYLACWQTSLGTSPFTFVQSVSGVASAMPTSTHSAAAASTGSTGSSRSATSRASATSSGTQTTSQRSSSTGTSASAAQGSSTSGSSNAAIGRDIGFGGGVMGLVGLVAQALL